MSLDIDREKAIGLARNLLTKVRHVAYSTVNDDGTPHNTPLMLIYNENLTKFYIGSYSESLHVKNILRTGEAYVVVYDSFTPGQGGIYIKGIGAKECEDEDLDEAIRVHNKTRLRYGKKQALDISFYEKKKPAQRMYSINIESIEIYLSERNNQGLIVKESRVRVKPGDLVS
jgi:general stress protein 26